MVLSLELSWGRCYRRTLFLNFCNFQVSFSVHFSFFLHIAHACSSKYWNATLISYVMRLRLGRRLVKLFPVAQRTTAMTCSDDGRTWVVGREFESHVHHEIAFYRIVKFLMSRTCYVLLDPHKLEPRSRASTCISAPFEGGRVLLGLDWVGDRSTFYLCSAPRTKTLSRK